MSSEHSVAGDGAEVHARATSTLASNVAQRGDGGAVAVAAGAAFFATPRCSSLTLLVSATDGSGDRYYTSVRRAPGGGAAADFEDAVGRPMYVWAHAPPRAP